MNTNGALQNTFWWFELGRLFNQSQDYVVFSIDGLESTNHVYRKNVTWSKIMQNVTAFVEAGGSAHWDMLVYRHNQDQVEECEQLARDMGFKWFRAKVSRRTFTKTLQFPLGWQPIVMQDAAAIECHALKEQSVYVDAQGNLSPCCWLGSRQQNFVSDVDNIPTQDPLCLSICGKSKSGTAFDQQWQKEVALC
jgi:sulfatase maturation enzyme AslB (radical SAM superfamily)